MERAVPRIQGHSGRSIQLRPLYHIDAILLQIYLPESAIGVSRYLRIHNDKRCAKQDVRQNKSAERCYGPLGNHRFSLIKQIVTGPEMHVPLQSKGKER